MLLLAFGIATYCHRRPAAFGVLLGYGLTSLALVVVIVAAFKILARWCRHRRLRAIGIAGVDAMDGLEFERYVAALLKDHGFTSIKLTDRFDLGVDIIARKDGVMWGIQVKRYNGVVKADAIRQVVTALKFYGCDRAMVITNSCYSRPAKKLAVSNGCVLVDRSELARLIWSRSGGLHSNC